MFDIVIANEYLQNVPNRGGPEASDSIKPARISELYAVLARASIVPP